MYMRSCLGIGVAFAMLGGAARAELPVHHDLPAGAAVIIAQGTLESCAAKGYAVSVVVVDRAGARLRRHRRADGLAVRAARLPEAPRADLPQSRIGRAGRRLERRLFTRVNPLRPTR